MSKRVKYAIMRSLLPPMAYLLIRLLRATCRIEHVNKGPVDRLWQMKEPALICFWHGRLFSAMPFAFQDTRFKVLISRHGDGEFIARVVRLFGIGAIRGSYRKASVSSVREIIQELRQGTTVGITPDGPKGPRHEFKEGIVEIARLTQKPIVPLTYSASRRKIFSSWDGFLLAYPFSRIFFVWGDPIYVPKDLSRDGIELKRREIEKKLVSLTEQADTLACGK